MFKTELELVDKIIYSVQKNSFKICPFDEKSTQIKSELNLGYGIPDIVIIKKDKKNANNRKISLSHFDISILETIKREKKISLTQIEQITCVKKSKIKTSLSLLMQEDLVKQIDITTFAANKYNYVVKNSVAIEAKLKDWNRALNQAYRYKRFSNFSYVILPESNIKHACININKFKRLNVGLAGLTYEGEMKIHFKPKGDEPICDRLKKYLNEVFI